MQIDKIVVRDKITKEEALKIISHPTEKYIQDIKPHADIIYQSGSDISGVIRQLDKVFLFVLFKKRVLELCLKVWISIFMYQYNLNFSFKKFFDFFTEKWEDRNKEEKKYK